MANVNDHISAVHEALGEHAVAMHIASLSVLGGWLVGVLPAIATALAACWYLLCIYESDTVQKMLHHKRSTEKDRRRDEKRDK